MPPDDAGRCDSRACRDVVALAVRAAGGSARCGGPRGLGAAMDREANEEGRPFPGPGLEADAAAVAIDDRRARERQALAGAAADVLGGEERIEHAVADRVGDTTTGVGDRCTR